MQFTKRLRDGVRRGDVTCSVRIWQRPHVKRGGRYPMGEGAIEVDSIEPIELEDVTPALARESGFASVVDLLKVAKHGSGTNVYLVRFHYLSKAGAPKAGPARGAKPLASAAQRKRVARLIAKLPEATAVPHGAHLSLEVRGKRFGYFLADHHGDGRVALDCKATAETREVLAELAPRHLHTPKYLGSRGWIGLWLDVPRLDWSALEDALRDAYASVAPKKLREMLED